MKLVIAEKPSVAMALASVIGARTRKDGYVEGNGYLVSWCVGHLVGLCDASEYDEKYKKWRYEDLPIVPECWKHRVLEGTKKQFGILKKLMRDSKVDEVICATDAGREGELIFRLVYEQAGCKKPMKRLWISSMEEQAIKDGFASLKDGSCYDSLYQSALCRAKADWLVGINASRLFSVLYNQNLKVGRVQTPTLAMIVDRNQKIKEFTKEKYYMAHIKFDEMDAVTEHFQKKEDADRVAADCMERMCEVEKDDVKEKTVRPPKLYDLTTLQREANRMFGYTAQQTLDAVQEMYEQKLVTYPRTDSQYLTDEMGESTETLIQMLLGKMPYAEGLEYHPDVSKVLNSKKVSDHHAIIPTMEVAKADIGELKERNRKILYLISARVLTATADPYIYESHKCQITCNYHTFYLTAKKTKQEGFKAIENKLKQFFGVKIEKEEPELDIWAGKHYGPCDSLVSEHFTQPPKQYTEDTLLSAMERAGNEELTEDTEKKGLGTPATRAAIIEKLIQSGFVKREKKNLVPTDDGNVLITVLPDEIKSPKMTAEWEMALNHIAQNTETADEFLNGITELMQELVARYQGISEEKKNQFQGKAKGEVIGKSVAMALASVIGARTRKDGYVEGNGYLVSWCVGHLVGLCDASEYDEKYKKWRYEDLPIVPECWKHRVLEGTKKQFGILKKLMRDSKVDEVICATDAGREGELIFRLVYEQAGCKKPMKRLWISSMEEQAIKDGFASLKDGSCYDSLYQSALCRAKADWLVGINASRLFSVLYNQNLKVGRVQTPTLAMIVDRNQKIKEFTKEKYYMAHIKFDEMDAVTEHFQKKEDADRVAADCMERMCEVEKDDVKEKTVRPPKLYDLTTLQREANRMFGYTAQQTLDAVQEMYEQKLVTYPRTDSQYLTDEMGESTETLIQMLLGKMPYAEGLEYHPDVSKVLNSKKVSDHHAIIPTMEVAKADIGELKERNRKILYLISARVLTATADPYIYESHKCQITCNYHTFYLTAKKTKQEGFKAIENKLKQFFGVKIEKEEPELDIWAGKHYGPCDSLVSEHFTQPPKQYTEDTLLSAMERAGNEELTEDTEKKGLGTPATRAAIIEKLIQSGFVKREKKNLVPTDDGNVLITVLPDEIKSPKMTAEWEMALNHIAQNTETADEFLNGITELMQELVARYQGISEEKKNQFQGKAKGEVIGKCPRCGADVQEGKVNFYCSDRNCTFTLWKNDKFLASQGKKMDKTAAKKFLSKGKIHYKDLVSRKTGRQYEATVEMVDPGEGNVQFNLIFPQR